MNYQIRGYLLIARAKHSGMSQSGNLQEFYREDFNIACETLSLQSLYKDKINELRNIDISLVINKLKVLSNKQY